MKLTLGSKYTFLQFIQLSLFFLISLNVGNLYFYLIFIAFFISAVANIKSLKIDIVFVLLSLISICYILFYPPSRNSLTTALKQFSYPMCYLIGLNLFSRGSSASVNRDADKQIKASILVVSIGALLHYFLNALTNFSSLFRNTIDFWTGDILSATGQALLAVMAMSVFSVWLFIDGKIWKKCLSLLGLIAIFAYNFVLAGRTILVLQALLIVVVFLYMQKHVHVLGHVKSFFFIILVLFAVAIIFSYNFWGVRDWILESNLVNRFDAIEALEDIRFERKMLYFSSMFSHILGGGYLRQIFGGYAHELYLDVYSDVGILGYVLVIAVVIMCTFNTLRLISSNGLSVETKCLLLSLFLAFNAVFFVEPILQGSPWLFCIFCFLSGLLKRENVIANFKY